MLALGLVIKLLYCALQLPVDWLVPPQATDAELQYLMWLFFSSTIMLKSLWIKITSLYWQLKLLESWWYCLSAWCHTFLLVVFPKNGLSYGETFRLGSTLGTYASTIYLTCFLIWAFNRLSIKIFWCFTV